LQKKGLLEHLGSGIYIIMPKGRLALRDRKSDTSRSSDPQHEFIEFIRSALGVTRTEVFKEWAGAERVTLAIVFTDIVGSTGLINEIRDEAMNEVRKAHFAQSRKLIKQFKGHEIKTTGDGFMVAFKSVNTALDYAIAFQKDTGNQQIQIRAGIHFGPMSIEEDDVFGSAVNFAARVAKIPKEAEIWISDPAKGNIDRLGPPQHKLLKWERHDNVPIKGFSASTLLSLQKSSNE
jgi:class 3 adenylate cyclase